MLTKLSERTQVFFLPEVATLPNLLYTYEGISLDEMEHCALLNRVDTKFVLSEAQLFHALRILRPTYRVLEIEGVRLNHYRTLYFDTDGFDLYHEHINRGSNCYKVRSREYLESQISFLEVKFKNQKKRTIKNRIKTDSPMQNLQHEVTEFLQTNYPFDTQVLNVKLRNTFTRITLVSNRNVERLTIDLNLIFFNETNQKRIPGLVVAEVKQDGFSMQSDFIQVMRSMGVRSTGFSKYCMGVSMLYDEVKKNSLKPKWLKVKKLQMGVNYG